MTAIIVSLAAVGGACAAGTSPEHEVDTELDGQFVDLAALDAYTAHADGAEVERQYIALGAQPESVEFDGRAPFAIYRYYGEPGLYRLVLESSFHPVLIGERGQLVELLPVAPPRVSSVYERYVYFPRQGGAEWRVTDRATAKSLVEALGVGTAKRGAPTAPPPRSQLSARILPVDVAAAMRGGTAYGFSAALRGENGSERFSDASQPPGAFGTALQDRDLSTGLACDGSTLVLRHGRAVVFDVRARLFRNGASCDGAFESIAVVNGGPNGRRLSAAARTEDHAAPGVDECRAQFVSAPFFESETVELPCPRGTDLRKIEIFGATLATILGHFRAITVAPDAAAETTSSPTAGTDPNLLTSECTDRRENGCCAKWTHTYRDGPDATRTVHSYPPCSTRD